MKVTCLFGWGDVHYHMQIVSLLGVSALDCEAQIIILKSILNSHVVTCIFKSITIYKSISSMISDGNNDESAGVLYIWEERGGKSLPICHA